MILAAGAKVTTKDEAGGDYPATHRHREAAEAAGGSYQPYSSKKPTREPFIASKSTALVLAVGKGHKGTVQALPQAKAYPRRPCL